MEKTENNGGKKYWAVQLDTDDIFNRVSLDSAYRDHSQPNGGDRYILLDEDRELFRLLVKNAVAELWLRLGRMAKGLAGGIRYTDDFVSLRLETGDNHDDNMLFVLSANIDRFVDAWALRQWFERHRLYDAMARCEQDASAALAAIVTVAHYRKKAVRRPIHPLL